MALRTTEAVVAHMLAAAAKARRQRSRSEARALVLFARQVRTGEARI